jgi:hypothetical protein
MDDILDMNRRFCVKILTNSLDVWFGGSEI